MAATLAQEHTRQAPNYLSGEEGVRQRSYQELHAAILELYRLMGVPRVPPNPGANYAPGYSVYGYPAPQAAAFVPGTNPFVTSGWPGANPSGYPTQVVLNPHGLPVPAFGPPHLEAGGPAWIPGFFAPTF